MSNFLRIAALLLTATISTSQVHGQPKQIASGTGFFINESGWAVTNAHVIEGCDSVEVRGFGAVDKILNDVANDIAVVHVKTSSPTKGLSFKKTSPRLGDEVLTLGYPLSGLLSDTVKLTTGNISSLAGIGNDKRVLQVSVPIQPGNSGGPLMDLAGQIVGVMTATLSKEVSEEIGVNTQNVNFAIKVPLVVALLEINGIPYRSAENPSMLQSVADIAEFSENSTVQIVCLESDSKSAEEETITPRYTDTPYGDIQDDYVVSKGRIITYKNSSLDPSHYSNVYIDGVSIIDTDLSLYLIEKVKFNDYDLIIGCMSGQGFAAYKEGFIISIKDREIPVLHVLKNYCIPRAKNRKIENDSITFWEEATAISSGEAWRWTPDTGFMVEEPEPYTKDYAKDWSSLRNKNEVSAKDLLDYPIIVTRIRDLFGANSEMYFRGLIGFNKRTERIGDYIFVGDCARGSCPNKSFIAIDLKEESVYGVYLVTHISSPNIEPDIHDWPVIIKSELCKWKEEQNIPQSLGVCRDNWDFFPPVMFGGQYCQAISPYGLGIRLFRDGSYIIAFLEGRQKKSGHVDITYFGLPRVGEFRAVLQADKLTAFSTIMRYETDLGFSTEYTISDYHFLESMQAADNLYVILTKYTDRLFERKYSDVDYAISLSGSRVAIDKLKKCF